MLPSLTSSSPSFHFPFPFFLPIPLCMHILKSIFAKNNYTPISYFSLFPPSLSLLYTHTSNFIFLVSSPSLHTHTHTHTHTQSFSCWCGPPSHKSPSSATWIILQPSRPSPGPPTSTASWPLVGARLTRPFGSGTPSRASLSSLSTPTLKCATSPGLRVPTSW